MTDRAKVLTATDVIVQVAGDIAKTLGCRKIEYLDSSDPLGKTPHGKWSEKVVVKTTGVDASAQVRLSAPPELDDDARRAPAVALGTLRPLHEGVEVVFPIAVREFRIQHSTEAFETQYVVNAAGASGVLDLLGHGCTCFIKRAADSKSEDFRKRISERLAKGY